MACSECFQNEGHKFSCSRADEAARVDWTQMRSSGHVAALFHKGVASYFDADLISLAYGNLWQGGCVDGVDLGDQFAVVVSLYPWERYVVAEGTKHYEFKMYDSKDGVDFDDLVKASDAVLEGLLNDQKTLVHCQAGLNRSGLVAAFTMMRLGYEAQLAIDVLRRARSPFVLCNEVFVKQLHELQHRFEDDEEFRRQYRVEGVE